MKCGYERVLGPDRLPQTPGRIQLDVTWSSGGINRREVPFLSGVTVGISQAPPGVSITPLITHIFKIFVIKFI